MTRDRPDPQEPLYDLLATTMSKVLPSLADQVTSESPLLDALREHPDWRAPRRQRRRARALRAFLKGLRHKLCCGECYCPSNDDCCDY